MLVGHRAVFAVHSSSRHQITLRATPVLRTVTMSESVELEHGRTDRRRTVRSQQLPVT